MSPSPRHLVPRLVALGTLVAGLGLIAGGCRGTDAARTPAASTASPAAATSPADASGETPASPESDRSRARRLAWEAAVAGVAEVGDRLEVTTPLSSRGVAESEREAAEARATNRRTALVAARVRLVRSQPDSAARWNDLGDALLIADRAPLAAAAYRAAEATAEGSPANAAHAGRALAGIAARTGAFDVAVDRMRAALAIEDDGDGHARLAVWLMYLGDLPAARAAVADADRLGGRVPAAARTRIEGGGRGDDA